MNQVVAMHGVSYHSIHTMEIRFLDHTTADAFPHAEELYVSVIGVLLAPLKSQISWTETHVLDK